MRFLLLLLLAAACRAEDPVEIPLSEVWAYKMPGAMSIQSLQSEAINAGGKSTFQYVVDVLNKTLESKGPRKPGFAYTGEVERGLPMLEAHLSGVESPQSRIKSGEDVYLVVFTYFSGTYIHAKRIERAGHKITIALQFTPHLTREVTSHLAIVPLGQLAPGEYSVDFMALPLPPRHDYAAANYESKTPLEDMCKPFSFTIAP